LGRWKAPTPVDEVQEREEEDPDEVDKVPVEAGDFDAE
jgi:hypothetical protein